MEKITLTMRELDITDDSLRETFKTYKSFFNNKSRFQAFHRFPVDTYTEETVDLTVLAAITKSTINTIDDILKSLLRKLNEEDHKTWENMKKYGNEDKFWLLIEKYYGYSLPEKSLDSLLKFLIITYLSQQNQTIEFPDTWQRYISNRPTNVVVFIDQWMNHCDERFVYNQLVNQVAEVIHADHYIEQWDVNDMVHMDAFKSIDETMIRYLVEQLNYDLTHFDHYTEIIAIRRKLHWYPEFELEYEAISHAVQLFRHMHEIEFPEQPAKALFHAYINDYYVIDRAYRKFYVAYDQIEKHERLYHLREKIENLYTNRFVEELAVKWAESLERQADKKWPITGISQQKDFYRDCVQPYQVNDERVFVIISDALRYEAAAELKNVLDNE